MKVLTMRQIVSLLAALAACPFGAASASNGSFDNGVNFTGPAVMATIYVRTSGSDSMGNGTSGLPYRTILRALQDALKISRLYTVVVDVTGLSETGPTYWA